MSNYQIRKRKITKKSLGAVQKAVDFFGTTDGGLANAIGVSGTLVGRWRRGEQAVSIRCAVIIEHKSHGKVKACDLCDYDSFLSSN